MAYDTTEAVAKFLSGFQMKITNRERDTVAPDYYVKYLLTLSKGGKDFSTTFVSDPRAFGEPTVTQVFSALADDALTLRKYSTDEFVDKLYAQGVKPSAALRAYDSCKETNLWMQDELYLSGWEIEEISKTLTKHEDEVNTLVEKAASERAARYAYDHPKLPEGFVTIEQLQGDLDLGDLRDEVEVSYEAVPESVATVPENVDYPRYAEAMESHVPLPVATQIAKHDFSHGQADILMEAARSPHVSPETLETIADKTLSSGKMRGLLDIASVGKNPLDFRNMDEQTLKAAVSVLFHGGKDLPLTELDLAQLRSVDLALMDGASPAEAMRAAEKSTSAEPEATAASLASEARDAKAARTELDSQSETKDAPTRAEKADGSL